MKKKSSISKVLGLSLAMTMAIGLLAGCGKEPADKEETSTSGTPATSESTVVESMESSETEAAESPIALEDVDFADVEFRIGWWGGDARHNNTLKLLENFGAKYKNLTVKEQYAGFGDYFTQIETQLTGNVEPDLYQMDWSKITSFVESDQLLDLTPYIESGALDLSNVDPNTASIGAMNGGIYAIATGVNSPICSYNTAIAEEAGVTVPKTLTWEELIDICKKVYDKTGAKANFDFEGYVRAHGETIYTEDGSAVGYSAQTLADWFTLQTEGMEYGFISTPEEWPNNMVEAFSAGEFWLGYAYTNTYHTEESSYAVDLDWFAYPISDENTATSFLKPNCLWVIKSDTENPDLAVAFLNDWVNDISTYEICGIDRGFPISSKIIEALEPGFDEKNKEVVEMLNFLSDEALLSTIEPPAPALAGAAKTVRSEYGEMVDYRLIDKADFLAKAEECIAKMNEALQAK